MLVAMLLLGLFVAGVQIQPVKSSGTIYIRADGLIDPPTAPIMTSDNVTYTFTGNASDFIVVERGSIVVDGAGYTLEGTGGGMGINLSGKSNVTIRNMEIREFQYGIYLEGSTNNSLAGNNVVDNDYYGVWIDSSSDGNTLVGNNITANNLEGIHLRLSSNNSLVRNTILSNHYGISLSDSSNNSFYHNSFANNIFHTIVDQYSINIWDDGYSNGGNYWSDYSGPDLYSGPSQNLNGSDGIGDTPYFVNENNRDNYPLIMRWGSPIRIRGDGSVYPSIAPIQRVGDTYSLTASIAAVSDGIIIERNNIILDGAGHTVEGGGANALGGGGGIGIHLSGRNGVVVKNTCIMMFSYGIYLDLLSDNNTIVENNVTANKAGILVWASHNNNISRNKVTHNSLFGICNGVGVWDSISENDVRYNYEGIFLTQTQHCELRNNVIADNQYGFRVWGNGLAYFLNDIDASNLVDGKPIYYWVNKDDMAVPSDAGCVILVNCTNITVQNLNLTKCGVGVLLAYTSNSTVRENSLSYNFQGIWLTNSLNNQVSKNNITNGGFQGMTIESSSGNEISGNQLVDNQYNFGLYGKVIQDFLNSVSSSNTVNGKPVCYITNQSNLTINPLTYPNVGYLALINSYNITIEGLAVENNYQGILLFNTTNSSIKNNNLAKNRYGCHLTSSSNNTISENSITGGTYGVFLSSSSLNTVSGNSIANDDLGLGCSIYLTRSSNDNWINMNNVTNTFGYGIGLSSSSNNVLKNNRMDDSMFGGFRVDGLTLSEYVNDVDASNSINGKPICYWVSKEDQTVPSNVGCVAIVNSTNITVQNLVIERNYQGIIFAYTNNSLMQNLTVTNNVYGIYLYSSSNNSVCRNEIANNSVLDGAGIFLRESSNNTIFHNNFVENPQNALALESYDNLWDGGYPVGGNLWSDYTGVDFHSGPYQNETGSDGIGDITYTIDASNTDHYPLMGAWTVQGENVTVTPSSDVVATFENVTSEGMTTVSKAQQGPAPPTGFKLVAKETLYYGIKTTASHTGKIQIRILYDDTGLTVEEESALQLTHWNEALQQWENITTWINTEKNVIYGETDQLSTFALVTMLVHEVSAKEIAVPEITVGQGQCISINVTILNQGKYTENLNFTVTVDTIIVYSSNITLASENLTTITITLNMSDLPNILNHTIIAHVEPVRGETDLINNTLVSWMSVTILGDINHDGIVEMMDFYVASQAYLSTPEKPNWNPDADINHDGIVEMMDFFIMSQHYLEHL
jgi:parallel beta-helix repeat protein